MDGQKGGLLLVMAHPDDESMGSGGLVLRHTRAGIPTYLICATYGEAGWTGKPAGAKKEDLPEIRAKELEEAAAALAIDGVELWDYPDGGVSAADHPQISQRITEQIVKLRPRAVVGWGPDGGYGHPEHRSPGLGRLCGSTNGELPAGHGEIVQLGRGQPVRAIRQLRALDGGPCDDIVREPQDSVDIVIELNADEVMMKLRAIDCHQSQLEDWRIAIRSHQRLMQQGYGREPYITVSSKAASLTGGGLLGEFG